MVSLRGHPDWALRVLAQAAGELFAGGLGKTLGNMSPLLISLRVTVEDIGDKTDFPCRLAFRYFDCIGLFPEFIHRE
jgi:hypothetical protein